MNTLQATTYLQFQVMIDTPSDYHLRRIRFILFQVINLVTLFIMFFDKFQAAIYFLSDLILVMTEIVMVGVHSFRLGQVIFNTLAWALFG